VYDLPRAAVLLNGMTFEPASISVAGFWDLGFHDTAEQSAKKVPSPQLLEPREPRKLTR
jgi:hypothetical protein